MAQLTLSNGESGLTFRNALNSMFTDVYGGIGTWAGSAISPAYGGTGVANNSANTITFTGSYSLGLTLSGATALTLPTGGTLLSTSVSANLSVGYTTTSYSLGTLTSGTTTLSAANGNIQHATNGGAFTLAPQSGASSIYVEITNNGSAGAITTSGYTKVVGTFDTTNGSYFLCTSVVTQNKSTLFINKLV